MDEDPRSYGLAPVARNDARALLLGSMPGAESLRARQYYAYPRNLFWKLIEAATGPFPEDYEERCRILMDRGLALWDVAHSCVRPGSLDADIRDEVPNNIAGFLPEHPRVRAIFFNGKKARRMFERLVVPGFARGMELPRLVTLPSSSPANARMSLEEKVSAWREVGEVLQTDVAGWKS